MIGLNAAVMSGCKSVGVHMQAVRFTVELSVKETERTFSPTLLSSPNDVLFLYSGRVS